MSNSFFAGYIREAADRFRKGRDVVVFSPDGLTATLIGPEGERQVRGEGAALLRQWIEEDEEQGGYAWPPAR